MSCAFLHSVHQPTYYAIKYNIYWLLSWIKVKGLMDGDVWEIVRIKNLKKTMITVPFLNWWGKSVWIIAAEKHRNLYGDWSQVFIVGIGIHYGLKGPEVESQWGRNLTWCPDRSWCLSSILYTGQGISFLVVKRLLCGIYHPPPSSTSVKEWGMREWY